MKLDRRMALGGGLAAVSGFAGHAIAEPEVTREEIFNLLFSDNNLGPQDLPPDDQSWRDARALLNHAPKRTTPYKVADYFATDIPITFRTAWTKKKLANPVIVDFWKDMHMGRQKPGDTTPWCSAFVNWCLWWSGITGTSSPNAQSFASWGGTVWKKSDEIKKLHEARPGDIAVFRDRYAPSHGHVGFFVGLTADQNHVEILGGNQGSKIGHTQFPIEDNQYLLTIRTRKGLRDA